VVINAQPATPAVPTVGAITQPTCALATGSVVLSGLPAGNWIINPGAINGNTVSTTVSGMATGSYNFTVTNAAGCTSGATANVVINAQPATPAPPTGLSTQNFCTANNPVISNLVATGTNILWYDVAAGGTPLDVNTPLADGTYYATQTSGGCESDPRLAVLVVLVSDPVTSIISGAASPLCGSSGITYSVDATAGSSYSWNVPADAVITSGETGPDNNQITVTFGTTSGSISVTETNSTGCQGNPVQLDVNLVGCNLVAQFTANDTNLCVDEEVVFTENSQGTAPGTTFEWDFGNGASPASATLSGPHVVSYSTPGLKSVRLIIHNGLSDTLLRTNYIVVNPVPSVVIDNAERCGPGSIDLHANLTNADQVDFSTDGGTTIAYTDNTAPYVFTTNIGPLQTISVMGRAYNTITGCYGSWEGDAVGMANEVPVTEKIASSHSITPHSGYVDIVCAGQLNELYYVNGQAGATYNWTIPSLGITVDSATQIRVNWNVPAGDYKIELQKISDKNCAGAVRDTLVLVSKPQPDLGPDVTICEGTSHTFSLTQDFSSYEWNDFSTNPTLTVSSPGKVYVKVWDEYQCTGSDTALLLVSSNPVVNLGKDTVLCGDTPLELNAGNFASYAWSTGETTNPIVVHEGAGTISVTVTNNDGCQGSDEIVILPCDPETLLGVIPNTFTPNGDNVHDTWKINNIFLFPDASIQIFDRWGRIVYKVDGGYDNNWHGTDLNGHDLPVDTYYYIIDLKVKNSSPIAGNVTIIR
jgi:gliding motility-associated-like protein